MANNPIKVNRTQKESKQIVAQQILQQAQSRGAYPQIVIAPEGTVGNRKSLLRFKLGIDKYKSGVYLLIRPNIGITAYIAYY